MRIGLKTIFCLIISFAGCSEKSTTPPEPPPVVPPVDPPPVERVHWVEGWPSWSPDGRYIYYQRPAQDMKSFLRYGQLSIWAYDTQTGKYDFFLGPGKFAKWNPEGTILAFNWSSTIFFYYVSTRTVRQVTDPGNIYSFDWAPDGGRLIFGGSYRGHYGCILVDTLGNFIYDLLPEGWRVSTDASWFGDTILVVANSDSFPQGAVILIDTLRNLLRMVLQPQSNRDGGWDYPSWSPNRTSFLLDVSFIKGGRSSGDMRLYSIDGHLLRIIAPEAGMGEWSFDGSKIAFQKYTWMGHSPNPDFEPDYGRVTVWTCNADGSDIYELLHWPQPDPDRSMFDGGYNWVTDTYNP